MSDLTSKFTREDIETFIEAMGDWEMVGNQEFHVLQLIKNAPMPPEDHDAYEAMSQIKDHFKNREREIMRSREVRQEKAVFAKAKLMLVRKDLGISELFDMAANTDPNSPMPEKKSAKIEPKLEPKKTKNKPDESKSKTEEALHRLELAEFFIKDLGVWDHYTKFLEEKSKEKVAKENESNEESPTE